MMMISPLYQTNTLCFQCLVCQLTETTCRCTRTHYFDSDPTSLCSHSLLLRAYRRSEHSYIKHVLVFLKCIATCSLAFSQIPICFLLPHSVSQLQMYKIPICDEYQSCFVCLFSMMMHIIYQRHKVILPYITPRVLRCISTPHITNGDSHL